MSLMDQPVPAPQPAQPVTCIDPDHQEGDLVSRADARTLGARTSAGWSPIRVESPTSGPRRWTALALVTLTLMAASALSAGSARAASYVPVSGAGSSWSANAIDSWRRNVNQQGLTINYAPNGSTDGRQQFRQGTVDFAVSEIPYGLSDNGVADPPPGRGYAYLPIVAGGTSFMYNLKINGQRVTNLRLAGDTLTKIFTGAITQWNDPAIAADNPGLVLPVRRIIPVVRGDGSGTTAQFSAYMAKQYPSLWQAYCDKSGQTACGQTSNYPLAAGSNFVAQAGSLGVSAYVGQDQSEGAITYVEYSYALNTGYPVAKLLNAKGFYNEPTAGNVAVALLGAQINNDASSPNYLTQDLTNVYNNQDPRAYPMSSYSYMILPTSADGAFSTDKGYSLGAFSYYFLCEGQQSADVLGYSALPINLVKAGLDQVKKIPGVTPENVDISKCNNPTFSSDGTNTLATTSPQPADCDMKGANQCSSGTGGAAKTPTKVSTAGGTSTGVSPVVGGSAARAAASGAAKSSGKGGKAPAPGRSSATAPVKGGVTPTVSSATGPGAGSPPGGQNAPAATSTDPAATTQVASGPATPGGGAIDPAGAGVDPAGGAVDPAGGAVDPAGAGTSTVTAGQAVNAIPISLAARQGDGMQGTLGVVAVALLIAVVALPPLISRAMSRSGRR
jgi:phosphate ABC transporter phosphate-binding protein